MNPEDQKAYVEIIASSYDDDEIHSLEIMADDGEFRVLVDKAKAILNQVADRLAEASDVYVIAQALDELSLEWESAGGDDDADA